MRKHLLSIILLSFTVSFLYANWEPLPNVPEVVSDGGCITYGGGYIWAVVGGYSNSFFVYDIGGDSWVTLESIPTEIDDAAAIAYEGGIDRKIFLAYEDRGWASHLPER
jgi:N-acetylneuraminic acid mutarotase